MRSHTSGALTTWIMLIPIIGVPLLAVFGIPRAGQVDASSAEDPSGYRNPLDEAATGMGQSAYCEADDLFASTIPTDDPVLLTPQRNAHAAEPTSRGRDWNDPFQSVQQGAPAAGTPPSATLQGWELDRTDGQLRETGSSADPHPAHAAATHPTDLSTHATRVAVSDGSATVTPPRIAPAQDPRFTRVSTSEHVTPPAVRQTDLTWQSAVVALNELGIRQYHLEPGSRANHFLFSCSYTPADNPRVTHRFEAEARQPLDAVDKVIQQVRQWRLTR